MFAVRITKKDEHDQESTYVAEESAHEDRDVVKERARRALLQEEVIATEVIPYIVYTDEDLKRLHKRWDDAISDYGEEKTFRILELVITSRDLENRNKATLLEKHPAFQLLLRKQQNEIHFHYDEDAIMQFGRRLLSALAVRHELKPIGQKAQFNQWIAVVHKLRAQYHPTPAKKEARKGAVKART